MLTSRIKCIALLLVVVLVVSTSLLPAQIPLDQEGNEVPEFSFLASEVLTPEEVESLKQTHERLSASLSQQELEDLLHLCLRAKRGMSCPEFRQALESLDDETLLNGYVVIRVHVSGMFLDRRLARAPQSPMPDWESGRYVREALYAFIDAYLRMEDPSRAYESLRFVQALARAHAKYAVGLEHECVSYLLAQEYLRIAPPEIAKQSYPSGFSRPEKELSALCAEMGMETLQDVVAEKPQNRHQDYVRVAYRIAGEMPWNKRPKDPGQYADRIASLQNMQTSPSWEALEFVLAQRMGVPERILPIDIQSIDPAILADPVMEPYLTPEARQYLAEIETLARSSGDDGQTVSVP